MIVDLKKNYSQAYVTYILRTIFKKTYLFKSKKCH